MLDIRPVCFAIGWLVGGLGIAMLIPMLADLIAQNGHWQSFAISATVTILVGIALILATKTGVDTQGRTSYQQTFVMMTGVYAVVPAFGAIPFAFGATDSTIIDALFEAISGVTTTGATVLVGLEELPEGILLWRGMLQWLGGIAIVVIALSVLPGLRIGGMQVFMRDNYETLSSVFPRAVATARDIVFVYLILTLACGLAYMWSGLSVFDATVHAMTTIATGGFSNYDTSFAQLGMKAEYVSVIFMILASLPFIRYVQINAGTVRPLLRDTQVHGFLIVVSAIAATLALWQYSINNMNTEWAIRKALFNGVSILTGTGYASEDYNLWGSFPMGVFFLAGLIGGCAGSTSCSIKIFRYQLLIASIAVQIRRIHFPHAVINIRYQGKLVPNEIMASVMVFFVIFLFTLVTASLLLAMTGLDFITAFSGAAAALANIGPGLGPEIGPAGNYMLLPDDAKIVLIITMLMGRLEMLVVFAIFSVKFWRG